MNNFQGFPLRKQFYLPTPTIRTFTSSGVWKKPAGCLWVKIIVTGGGGGGAAAYYGGSSTYGFSGCGGTAGGTSIKLIDVTNINQVSITIGAGGTGGSYPNSGTSGGTSSFGSYCSATGGTGATYGSLSNTTSGVGSGGDINLYGGMTDNQWSEPSSGNIYVMGSPKGGNSYWRGCGGGHYSANGDAAFNWGSGGGGGSWYAGSCYAGGNGKSGVVIVEEYYA